MAVQATVTFPGGKVKVGGGAGCTIIVRLAVMVLLQISVYVQFSVYDPPQAVCEPVIVEVIVPLISHAPVPPFE